MGKQVNKKELAEIVGVSEQTLTRWQADASFPVLLAGKRGTSNIYDTEPVIDWLIRRELSKLTRVAGEIIDYEAERARLTKAQADHEELKVSILRADVLPTPLVIQLCQAANAAARAKLLGLHGQIRARYPDVPEAVLGEIQYQIRQSLEELGHGGLPDGLRNRVARYLEDLEAAADAALEPVGG